MDGSTKRVLVVEDDPLVLRAYRRALAGRYDVVAVETGAAALRELERGGFGAIVSDIEVPGTSGIELLKTLRDRSEPVPVILVTGRPTLESAQDAVNYGAFRYLTKPVTPEALLDAVGRATRLSALAELHAASRAAIARESGAPEHADLTSRFESALAGLFVVFQPIVSWELGRAVGYEALLRTGEPSLARPPDFLDAAETLGRLGELGRRVRAAIAAEAPRVPEDARVFVNLHARDLLEDDLIGGSSPLCAYARRIVLEVTERASLDHVPEVAARVRALRAAGFAIAIDDLGAGYAGLASLTQLDPDVVKLDMSLVRGIDQSRKKQQILRSMVQVCEDLAMEVVVEGVETIEERDALLDLGCDRMQGYLFARPSRELGPVVLGPRDRDGESGPRSVPDLRAEADRSPAREPAKRAS